MPNQVKKNSLPSDSMLNPVGKVIAVTDMWTQMPIGIAQVNIALAPVGSELYVRPSEGRLTCEVEVANANALHWKDGLNKANERHAETRMLLNRARGLLRLVKEYGVPSVLQGDINKFLSGE